MVVNDSSSIVPKRPNLDALNFGNVSFSYDRESDTLPPLLFGRGRPAVILPGDESVELWLDPGSGEIIGFQIEGNLSRVVHEHLHLLGLAELAGIDADEIERIRHSITPG